MFALDPNIARQTTKPSRRKSAPQNEAEEQNHRPQQGEESSCFSHHFNDLRQ